MNFDKKHIITGVIATSVAIPLCSSISNADSIDYRTITGNSVNFRKGPGTNYGSMTKLNKGNKVEYLGKDGSWIKAKYNGKTGYVHSDYVSAANNSNGSNESIKSYKIVNASSLNLRSGAGTKYSKIGSIPKGKEVGVISESNGWSKIKYSGKVGYVSSKYLINKDNSSQGSSNESIKKYKIVDATSLNIRSGPGTNYSKIGSIANGKEVGVISESNGWSKVKYSGKVGYVSSKYLTEKGNVSEDNSTSNKKADKVINFAKTLLGKDYSWGAEGPNSFDCSGYTYYVFKKSVGVSIPRVSRDQSKHGKSVSRSNVVKGDLVFFDTEGSNNGQVTHVGIYMGGGKFIHASSSKDEVVISDFNSSYYKKAFVNARRVL